MYVQVMHPSQFRRVRGAERRRSSSGRATRANPCQLGWHSPCVTTATATLSHECTAQKQSTRAAPQRPRSRAAHTVPDTAEAVDPAESCDDVAGGCQAPWDDSEVRLSNPTPVRAQLLESDPGERAVPTLSTAQRPPLLSCSLPALLLRPFCLPAGLNQNLISSQTTVAQIFNQVGCVFCALSWASRQNTE